jgi:hypothetical protein
VRHGVVASFVACGTSLSCLACVITRWGRPYCGVRTPGCDLIRSPKGELCASSLLSPAVPWGVTSAGRCWRIRLRFDSHVPGQVSAERR